MSLSADTKLSLLVASFSIVPFYCTPFLIASFIDAPQFSNSLVNFIPTIMMGSQLAFVIILPLFFSSGKIQSFIPASLLTSSLIIAFITLSGTLGILFFISIVFTGFASACLFFYGTSIALESEERPLAFLTRLAFSLILAGIVSTTLVIFRNSLGIASMLLPIAFIYFCAAIFLWNFKIPSSASSIEISQVRLPQLAALFLVVIFFISQTGFYVFHASFYKDDVETTLALSTSRIVSGSLILLLPAVLFTHKALRLLILWLAVEALSILLLSQRLEVSSVLIAIVLYEFSLNALAIFVQSEAGTVSAKLALKFLAPCILLGATIGPFAFSIIQDSYGEGYATSFSLILLVASVLLMKLLSARRI